jgi:hypothetical protein
MVQRSQLSDGLSRDLYRLCLASGVAAEIEGSISIFRGATLEQALDGGEDYELLFTVRPRTEVPRSFEGLPLARIGTIRKGRPGPRGVRRLPAPAARLRPLPARVRSRIAGQKADRCWRPLCKADKELVDPNSSGHSLGGDLLA